VDLADAVSIVIARPFFVAMADASVLGMDAWVVGCFICIQDRALTRHIPLDNRARGRFVGMFEYPVPHLVRAAADETQDRWPVVLVGALAFALHPEGTRRGVGAGQQGRDAAYFFSPAF
jgi:hypothetical protein